MAILLVIGALLVRRYVTDDGDDAGQVSTNAGGAADELVCITELREVCRALDTQNEHLTITVEDASVTLDRLAALEDSAYSPLWLTVEPFPAMVDAVRARNRAAAIEYDSTVLGASPLGVALKDPDHLDVLLAECGPDPLWRCIGDLAGAPWSSIGGDGRLGEIRPAFGMPSSSALGLAALASAVSGYLGPEFGGRDLAQTGFVSWFRPISRTAARVNLSGGDGSALSTMATRAAPNVAATAGFEAAALDAAGDRFALNYPEPAMWLHAVLATPAEHSAPNGLAGDLTALLHDSGWDPADVAGNPLPNASTMLALRDLWEDAT